jgi:hypothetical protein
MLKRRQLFMGALAAVLPASVAGWARREPWEKAAYRKPVQSRVAILGAQSYDRLLEDLLLRGLQLFQFSVHDKTVVLKPNLVEYDPAGIAAAIEAYMRLGARMATVPAGLGIAGIMSISCVLPASIPCSRSIGRLMWT